MSTQQVTTAVGAHLVGGLKAADSEAAMRTAAGILGRHLYAITDGETGERSQWIGWQIARLTAIEGIELAGTHGLAEAENQDYAVFPALAVDASVTELPARALGYADAAQESYASFCRLRDEGVVPGDVRFQVSVPTPYATVVTWVREEDQQHFLPVYADAIADEVAEIVRIVGADLLLQYDVAVEVGARRPDRRAPAPRSRPASTPTRSPTPKTWWGSGSTWASTTTAPVRSTRSATPT